MYLDIIFGSLAIIIIYLFVIKDKPPKFSIKFEMGDDIIPYFINMLLISCFIFCLDAFFYSPLDRIQKKFCIIGMLVISVYLIYKFIDGFFVLEKNNFANKALWTIIVSLLFWTFAIAFFDV